MRLEFVRIEEANDLINHLIEHHPYAIFVANHELKIEFCNNSFKKLVDREKHEIIGKEFCEALGCIYRGNIIDIESQYCKKCRMREMLSGSSLAELDLIRDFKIHNNTTLKHLYFTVNRVVMNGKKLRLVEVEDRTHNF